MLTLLSALGCSRSGFVVASPWSSNLSPCDIATSVARPELLAVTEPATSSRCWACRRPLLRGSDAGVPRTYARSRRWNRAAAYSIAEFRRQQSSSTGFLAGWTFEQGQRDIKSLSSGRRRRSRPAGPPPTDRSPSQPRCRWDRERTAAMSGTAPARESGGISLPSP